MLLISYWGCIERARIGCRRLPLQHLADCRAGDHLVFGHGYSRIAPSSFHRALLLSFISSFRFKYSSRVNPFQVFGDPIPLRSLEFRPQTIVFKARKQAAAMNLPPPPPGVDLKATQQTEIVGSIIATWVFAVICVALRFFARRISRAGFWWDDWLMIPALVKPLHCLDHQACCDWQEFRFLPRYSLLYRACGVGSTAFLD